MFVIVAFAAVAQAESPPFVPPVTPGEKEAVIYFCRDSLVSDWFGTESIYVHGHKVCDLRRNEYSHVVVAPGSTRSRLARAVPAVGRRAYARIRKAFRGMVAAAVTLSGTI
jgi:hypothetical protein